MKTKLNLIKIFNLLGCLLFIFALISILVQFLPLKYDCLLFLMSCFLMLPDSIVFVKTKYKENSRFGLYWISKFIGLIFAIIIFAVGLIVVLKNGY